MSDDAHQVEALLDLCFVHTVSFSDASAHGVPYDRLTDSLAYADPQPVVRQSVLRRVQRHQTIAGATSTLEDAIEIRGAPKVLERPESLTDVVHCMRRLLSCTVVYQVII